jgi:hypothetical protein
MARKILVPLEGSYKEYNKFAAALRGELVWRDLLFFVDTTLDAANIEQAVPLREDAPVDSARAADWATQWLRRGGYAGTFDRFCMVEYHQNWMMLGDLAQARTRLLQKFIAIARQLEALDYDTVLCGAVSQFFSRSVVVIARALGKPVLLYTQSLIPGREFIRVDSDEFDCAAIGVRMRNPSVTQRASDSVARDVLEQVVTGKKRGTYMGKLRRNFMEDVRISRSIRNRLTPRHFTLQRLRYWLDRFLLRALKAWVWRGAATDKLPQGRFLFFPLHMPGEAQTLVRGYPFFDDVSTLVQLSGMLPPDVLIVAKEHPGYEGWLPLDALRRLKLCPNVVIARSRISSHKIIAACTGIVTINSSVWFESFAFGKPVIALGRGIFFGHGIVHEAGSLEALQEALDRLLADPAALLPPRERVHRFVEALNHHSIPGYFYGLIAGDTQTFLGLITALLNDSPESGEAHGHHQARAVSVPAAC